MNSIIFLSISIQVIIIALALRYRREITQAHLKENAFSLEKIARDRYTIRNNDDPIIIFSSDMFQRELYTEDKETSRSNFITGLRAIGSDEEALVLLKTRLMEAFKLREVYETTLASSKDEQYRESSVMGTSINMLRKYEDETNLVHYCALLLDTFDKDREYKYGLCEVELYTTRYIYGSVQAIVEEEIGLLESFEEGIAAKINNEKEKLEVYFYRLYNEEN